jgi:putative tryptophan/tyrosine transport system substrate-binding protein
LALVLACPPIGQAADRMVTIGITQIVEHPALDADRKGFIDEFKDQGYVEGKNVTIEVHISQGNMATANTIAKGFVGRSVDLIYSIATPTSQAAANATKTIPIVISSVTDPVGAGLVKNLEQPGGNVTGTTDRSPVDRQMDLIREIVPAVSRIGVI